MGRESFSRLLFSFAICSNVLLDRLNYFREVILAEMHSKSGKPTVDILHHDNAKRNDLVTVVID